MPDREQDPQDRHADVVAGGREYRVDVVDEEVEILEEPQHAEVRDDAQAHEDALALRPPLHPAGRPVVDDGGRGDEDQEPGMDVAIEEVAGDEQQQVLPAVTEAASRRRQRRQRRRRSRGCGRSRKPLQQARRELLGVAAAAVAREMVAVLVQIERLRRIARVVEEDPAVAPRCSEPVWQRSAAAPATGTGGRPSSGRRCTRTSTSASPACRGVAQHQRQRRLVHEWSKSASRSSVACMSAASIGRRCDRPKRSFTCAMNAARCRRDTGTWRAPAIR